MKKSIFAIAILSLLPVVSNAGDLTVDSAIGGAIGGAVGGAVGAELGGRDGAIVGSGIGAAVGTSVNTRDHRDDGYRRDREYREVREEHHYYHGDRHNNATFCPPGQAKKGRC